MTSMTCMTFMTMALFGAEFRADASGTARQSTTTYEHGYKQTSIMCKSRRLVSEPNADRESDGVTDQAVHGRVLLQAVAGAGRYWRSLVARIEAAIVDVLIGGEPSVTGAGLDGLLALRAGQTVPVGFAGLTLMRLLSNVKVQRALTARIVARSQRTEVAADRTLLEIARVGFSDLRRIFHEDGGLKHPHEWDDDTAASIASVEVVTRNLGDGTVEYVHKIKLWDKGKALEQLCKHLGLYQNQEASEQPKRRPLTDLTDEELYQRLLDTRVRLNRAIELEQGIHCQTRLLEGGKPTPREGSAKGLLPP